jgi:hypothetical protein
MLDPLDDFDEADAIPSTFAVAAGVALGLT